MLLFRLTIPIIVIFVLSIIMLIAGCILLSKAKHIKHDEDAFSTVKFISIMIIVCNISSLSVAIVIGGAILGLW